jgi:hypothetical protein
LQARIHGEKGVMGLIIPPPKKAKKKVSNFHTHIEILHAVCSFHTLEYNFDTYDTLECDLYMLSVISTRTIVI